MDPGGTTGLSWWISPREPTPLSQQLWGQEQIGACSQELGLCQLFLKLDDIIYPYSGNPRSVHLAMEGFDFRKDEQFRTKIDYTAAEVIGATRFWTALRPQVTLIRSGAGLGKGFWGDDKIKKLNLWVPGKKHAMDARRHLLRYMVFELQMNELLLPLR
jgi:hypothetical protein